MQVFPFEETFFAKFDVAERRENEHCKENDSISSSLDLCGNMNIELVYIDIRKKKFLSKQGNRICVLI